MNQVPIVLSFSIFLVACTACSKSKSPVNLPVVQPINDIALPAAYTGLSSWGIDAPNDADQAAFVASGGTSGGDNGTSGYSEKVYSAQLTSLNQLPTIMLGGNVRFGPTTVDGVPAMLHNIHQGDALRYRGNRSGLVYDDFKIYHGHDYWFAWAFKLGTEWDVTKSGGHQDRVGLWDTHQTIATIGNPAGLVWWGDSPAGKELWLYVERMDGCGPAYLYNFPAAPGQWQRLIMHYRSGGTAQGPVFDAWTAIGKLPFVKLVKTNDPYTGMPWDVTPPIR